MSTEQYQARSMVMKINIFKIKAIVSEHGVKNCVMITSEMIKKLGQENLYILIEC